MDKILTLDEVCERYRITRPTWRKVTEANPVPSFVIGNRVWIREEDLIEWERRNTSTRKRSRRGPGPGNPNWKKEADSAGAKGDGQEV